MSQRTSDIRLTPGRCVAFCTAAVLLFGIPASVSASGARQLGGSAPRVAHRHCKKKARHKRCRNHRHPGHPTSSQRPSTAIAVFSASPSAQGVADPNRGSILFGGETLAAGQYLLSGDGHYRLFMQGDGNLVEYVGGRALWASDTAGDPGGYLAMQGDGNLVLYSAANQPLWSSSTAGHPGARLALQSDANLVIYSSVDAALWSNSVRNTTLGPGETLTGGEYLLSSDAHYLLFMQGDGNLVEYVGSQPLWASDTAGHPGAYLGMQGTDGNLVVYGPGGEPLWNSGTAGHPGARLALQPDANLVVYSPADTPLWANGAFDSTLGPGETLTPGEYLEAGDRHHTFVMQGDGNLVLYGDNGALWSSDTAGHPGAWLGMQGTDGNLVVYGPGGQPLWSSATAGNAGARLAVQTDGNAVIYTTANTAIWSTGTSGGGGALPLGTAAENAAIAWARPYADAHNVSYNGLCLTFVFNAYSAAGITLRNWVSVPIGSNTYPADIWGHFSHGTTGGGTPPLGALVFWNPVNGNRENSHVALSTGGGNLVSSSDGVANYTHYETIAQHSFALYLGWWLPDQ
jgi:hypothetical protein